MGAPTAITRYRSPMDALASPAVADLNPRLRPRIEVDLDLAGIDIVVNTHLQFDHCGGNHLSPAGRSISSARSWTRPNGALSGGRSVGRDGAWSATADHSKDAEGRIYSERMVLIEVLRRRPRPNSRRP
jgi:glyoxylase-like metal-dependent hydrolase (beta-lactamase superfamily II)